MRIVLVLPLVLAFAAPAAAQLALTPTEAHNAAYVFGRDVLAPAMTSPSQTATVKVGTCRIRGRRGVCNARLTGGVHCTFRVHVVEGSDDFSTWADRLRC